MPVLSSEVDTVAPLVLVVEVSGDDDTVIIVVVVTVDDEVTACSLVVTNSVELPVFDTIGNDELDSVELKVELLVIIDSVDSVEVIC